LLHPQQLSATRCSGDVFASAVDRDMEFCFLDDQLTNDWPMNWQALEVDFWSTLSLAQSESE
jgi:hypothetical protein